MDILRKYKYNRPPPPKKNGGTFWKAAAVAGLLAIGGYAAYTHCTDEKDNGQHIHFNPTIIAEDSAEVSNINLYLNLCCDSTKEGNYTRPAPRKPSTPRPSREWKRPNIPSQEEVESIEAKIEDLLPQDMSNSYETPTNVYQVGDGKFYCN